MTSALLLHKKNDPKHLMNLSIVLHPTHSTILQQYTAFTDHSPPIDVLRLICSFLSGSQDVVHFGLANRRLTVLLLSDTALWNLFLHKHFPNSYAKHQSEIEGLNLYKHLTNISNNIKTGKCHLTTLHEHRSPINCMINWNDHLISASWGTIKIWNLNTEQKPQMLSGNPSNATCMTLWNDELVSALENGTIEIWDLNNKSPSNVTCMTLWNDKLVSGSGDGTIKIRDLNTGQELQTLKGHQSKVTCMIIWGDKLISGSEDGTIKIWDLNTGQKLRTLKNIRSEVTCMTIWNDELVSALENGTITIWNLNTREELKTFKESERIECMTIWNDQLVCGLEAPWFHLWDLNRRQSLKVLSVHGCGAYGIMIWNDKFVSISGDETVRIWDPNTQLYFWKQVDKGLRYRGCMTAVSDSKFATSSNQTINIWDFSSPRLTGVDLKSSKKRLLDNDEHASTSRKKRS